jgi:hypothetical protein
MHIEYSRANSKVAKTAIVSEIIEKSFPPKQMETFASSRAVDSELQIIMQVEAL